MKSINVYLTFDGNCRAAMEFYATALEAHLDLMTGDQMPGAAESDSGRILHARLQKDDISLMASDTMSMTPFKLHQGNNFSIRLDCADEAEQDRFFDRRSDGATVTMSLQDTFWNARFGMLTDRFGVQWMLNLDHTPGQ